MIPNTSFDASSFCFVFSKVDSIFVESDEIEKERKIMKFFFY